MIDQVQTGNIMIVDDTPENLRLLDEILSSRGHQVCLFPRGALALRAAEESPPDLILLDINMPEMDGYEVCRRLKANPRLKNIVVIFLSAYTELEHKIDAFRVGGVDYITKPFQSEEVLARVETHLKLERLKAELAEHNRNLEARVQAQVREIADSQMATIFALAKLAESRDAYTGAHIDRVRSFCHLLADHLSSRPDYHETITPRYRQTIFEASALHDIGKVAVPDSILLKPAKLTSTEYDTMKMHTVYGKQTLEAVAQRFPGNSFVTMGIQIAGFHHEWWNGSGYPARLQGREIPLCARIMALVDVYDALCSRRPYKPAYPHEHALEVITRDRGTHFAPDVVDAFLEIEDQFHTLHEELAVA